MSNLFYLLAASTSYSSYSSYPSSSSYDVAAYGVSSIFITIFSIVYYAFIIGATIVGIIAMWKIFEKARCRRLESNNSSL